MKTSTTKHSASWLLRRSCSRVEEAGLRAARTLRRLHRNISEPIFQRVWLRAAADGLRVARLRAGVSLTGCHHPAASFAPGAGTSIVECHFALADCIGRIQMHPTRSETTAK